MSFDPVMSQVTWSTEMGPRGLDEGVSKEKRQIEEERFGEPGSSLLEG